MAIKKEYNTIGNGCIHSRAGLPYTQNESEETSFRIRTWEIGKQKESMEDVGMEYRVAVLGLGMGDAWGQAAVDLPQTRLIKVFDPAFDSNPRINREYFREKRIPLAASEEEIYNSDADIIVVATPDHLHMKQAVRALHAGKHVICEKPLAPTVAECREILAAVKKTSRSFMTGQVCRYAPGFKLAKQLLGSGRIGELVALESEYAHDYSLCPGWQNWRCSPDIRRQGFLGGGCHALDLMRWLAGNPLEVFAYMNHKFLPSWPTADTAEAVVKFPDSVIGRLFVSIGVKRPYTMRTVIYGTAGTIICDNTSSKIQICEESVTMASGEAAFAEIPVRVQSHNVRDELADFVDHIAAGKPFPTDEREGTCTVAFAEAAIRSAETGTPERIHYDF